MKVALIVQHFPFGGAESYVEQIAQRLHANGKDVTVISSKNNDYDDRKLPFPVIRLPKLFSLGEYSFWRGLGTSLKHGNFDLIHINTYGYFHSDYTAFLKKKHGYKLIMTSHGFTGLDLHQLKKNKLLTKNSLFNIIRPFYDSNIGKKTILKCDHLIALSKRDMEFYDKIGVSKSKISLIPPGIRESFFDLKNDDVKKLHDINADPLLLSVGELSWIKNHAMAINAMPQILEKKPQAKLIIIGRDNGELSNLKQLCHKLNVENNVNFLGFKNTEEVSKYMRSADLLLHTSLAEGLSTVLLESMASGLPFITTPAGGNAYLAEESKAGLTVPFEDEITLANTITTLVEDKSKLENMALNGRAYAKDLSWNKVFERINNVYNMLLNHDRN